MSDTETTNQRKELIKQLEQEALTNRNFEEIDGDRRREGFKIRDGEKVNQLLVLNLPHDEFLYNIDNVRIIASREQWEGENPGKTLSPIHNVAEIESFLMENPTYGKETTEELAESIKGEDYLRDPILISEDGVVWNGNRRLSVVRSLLKDPATYQERYKKVPVCILPSVNFDELKALEGRLQVQKTFKQEYGTFEIRLEIRRARKAGDSWGKIRNQFGQKFSVSDLKNMLSEIEFVDDVLSQVGRPKDYTWASKMGKGTKGGIEIWKIPHTDLKSMKRQLVETERENSDGTVSTTPVANPDPIKFGKIKTQWVQQLLNPEVSHDTIRQHNKVRSHEDALKEYEENDNVTKDYVKLTTEMVTEGGVEIPKAFTMKEVKNAVKNSTSAFDLTSSTDPKDYADKALTALKKIKDDCIPHNNQAFKLTLKNIGVETKRIEENENFSA